MQHTPCYTSLREASEDDIQKALSNLRPNKRLSLLGRRFERWTVIDNGTSILGKTRFLCECDCGQRRVVYGYYLRSGRSKSCGCLKVEKTKELLTTHGALKRDATLKNKTIFNCWCGMRQRCFNPKTEHFKYYGGRGITVCAQWTFFHIFYRDMEATWEPGLSIDRINNDDGYFKSNCRWATRKEQTDNRRKQA